MAMDGGIMDFVNRFRDLQGRRDSYDELVKDILVYSERVETTLRHEVAHLQSQLQDATLDLADATKSRRDLQQQLQQVEARNSSISQDNQHLKVRGDSLLKSRTATGVEIRLQNTNSYVIVLIDGDGLFFKAPFVNQGVVGGKKAAHALRTAILKQCGDHASEIDVMAKFYANLSGLCKTMRRDLSLENESDLKDFSLGFTQAKASFDSIDVGHGKERTDNKIKETTKWNLRNHNCKQVILGISHDAGYAPFLDELLQDEATRRRVTVLEGFPTVRELVATGVNILNLNDALFRNEKLVDRTGYSPSPPVLNAIHVPGVIGPPSITSVAASVTSAASANSTPATPATSTASTPTPAPSSYARAIGGNASPPPQITLPLQTRLASVQSRKIQAKPQPPPWNPGERGLDPPIQVSQAALDNIKKRKDSNKLCNNHYLRGPCAKGDSCCFEHKYKPSKDELNAIAFLTRLNPCENGQDCEVENCIYGHHCPSVRDGACTHPYCKFQPRDHPPGTKLRSKSHEY